jgi:lysophospholipase L1-like esterase
MSGQPDTFPSFQDIPDSVWDELAQKRILFGHQSVGFDIMRGLEEILGENPSIPLKVAFTREPASAGPAGLFHFEVGRNGDPLGKIRAFASLMENEGGEPPDIAFVKLCYADITDEIDVQEIYDNYLTTMNRLAEAFPHVAFVHITTPLTGMPNGMDGLVRRAKDVVKRIIGRPVVDLRDNSRRHALNEMMRRGYAGTGRLFDLAAIESTYPDGTRKRVSRGGDTFYSLVGGYTDDGGHLNAEGRRRVAEQLLVFLAQFGT